jgi:cob(I)alamin adenosyltransferase
LSEQREPRDGRRRGRRQAAVTTRTGDDGYTGLLGKARVPKWHPRPEAFGTLDEATSALGLARAFCSDDGLRTLILAVQRQLYVLMAELATDPDEYDRAGFRITAEEVRWLEVQAEALKIGTDIGREFVIPGESPCAAALDLARTIIRRGERLAARMFHDGEITNAEVLRYLNRLSDLVFIAARRDEFLMRGSSRSSRDAEPGAS